MVGPGLLFLIYKSVILGGPSTRWGVKSFLQRCWPPGRAPLFQPGQGSSHRTIPAPCRRKPCQSRPHRCCKVLRYPKYRIGSKSKLHFTDFAKRSLQSLGNHVFLLPILTRSWAQNCVGGKQNKSPTTPYLLSHYKKALCQVLGMVPVCQEPTQNCTQTAKPLLRRL